MEIQGNCYGKCKQICNSQEGKINKLIRLLNKIGGTEKPRKGQIKMSIEYRIKIKIRM